MKLKKISFIAKDAGSGYVDISFDSRWACDWYVELMNRHVQRCNARFIEIVCTGEPAHQPVVVANESLIIEQPFDLDVYRALSPGHQKRLIARTIHDCLVRNSLVLAISEAVVAECSRSIEEEAFTRTWCGRKAASIDKRHYAQLEYLHDIHTFSVHLRIDDREGRTLQRISVGVEVPDSLVFAKLIGEIRWFADGSLEISGERGVYFSTKP